MKKRHLMLFIVMVACLAALYGYRAYDSSVTDRKAPVITVEDGVLQISVHDPESALLQGITAKDDRDGDVTDSVIVESVGSITDDAVVTVTYAAFDKAGNVAKISRPVQYTDYISPRFTLDAPLAFAQGSGFDILDHVGAVDELEGDLTHRVKVTSLAETAISAPGVYDVQLQVANSLGDIARLMVQVEVYPSGTYNSKLTLTDYILYIQQGVSFDARDYLDTFTYAGTTADLSRGISRYDLSVSGSVDTGTPGVYAVEYVISFTQGSQIYNGFSELIVVVEG